MKKSFMKVLMLALAIVSVGVLGSCKDYEEDKYNDLQHQIADQNKTLTDALAEQKAYLEGLIAQIKQCDCDKSIVEKAVQDIEALKARCDASDAQIAALGTKLDEAVANIIGQINDINQTLVDVNATLAAHGAQIEGILDQLQIWTDRVVALETEAANAKARIDALEDADEELRAEIEAAYADAKAYADALAEGLAEDIAANKADIEALTAEVAQNSADIAQNKEDIAFLLIEAFENHNKFMTIYGALAAINEWQEATDERLSALESKVEALDKRIDDLYEEIEKIVTGVTVQGTMCPAFGSINLPGIQANLLAAYYGTAVQSGEFPHAGVSGDGRFVKNSVKLTDDDMAVIAEKLPIVAGQLISNDADNAGTMYVTVNPNTVDFTGKTITLVNSLDEECKVTVAALEKCDEELTFGWSRADNGLYAAKVQVKAEDAPALNVVDTEALKENAKAIYNEAKQRNWGNGAVASEFVLAIYNQINGKVPAYAVKADYNFDGKTHSVYSNYDVAVSAIKPLSFSFMEDFDLQSTRAYQKGLELADRLTNAINSRIQSVFASIAGNVATPAYILSDIAYEENRLDADGVTPADFIAFTIEFTEEVTLDKVKEMFDPFCGIYVIEEGHKYRITIFQKKHTDDDPSINAFFPIFELLWANSEETNAIIEQLNNELNAINSKGEQMTGLISALKNKLINLLNRVTATKFFSPNRWLMPALVVNTPTHSVVASRTEGYPTVVASTDVDLMPTSWTAELIAPAYKKIVVCTKAWKNGAESTAARKALNDQENINKILAGGNATKLPVTLEKGVKYEIAYAAVDYSGMIAVQKLYVECK